MKILEDVLDKGDSSIKTQWRGMWGATIWLEPSHVDTARLLAEAGVQPKRLNTPLVSFWRHHHLGNDSERREAFEFAGDRYDPQPGRESGVDWFEPMMAAVTPVDEHLRPDSHALEEPSPIIINGGAHMVSYELGKRLTAVDHLEALRNMVCPPTGHLTRGARSV